MILLDDVEVDESALLPDSEGLRGPMGCLNNARYVFLHQLFKLIAIIGLESDGEH